VARESVGGGQGLLGVTHSILGPGVLTKLPRLNLEGVEVIRLAAEKDKALAAEL